MKRTIVAIGGGENGRILEDGSYAPYETELIDKEIIKLTGKEKPNFLFLGHAFYNSIDIQNSYYETMKKIYGERYNCNCQVLTSEEIINQQIAKDKVNWADIIYEGGGDTEGMIKLWKDNGFDQILYDAWQKGKVICGISAGAVCWFRSCTSDSSSNKKEKFKSVECLDWHNLHVTPHCDEEGRYAYAKKQLKENNLVGIMLSNRMAMEIIDDKCKFIITDSSYNKKQNEPYAIKAYWTDESFKKYKIKPDKTYNIQNFFDKGQYEV